VWRKGRGVLSYISEELKSASERYILVEAIDIAIRAGVWNIYIAEGVKNRCSTTFVRIGTYEIERI
jgi:hypothetical protein